MIRVLLFSCGILLAGCGQGPVKNEKVAAPHTGDKVVSTAPDAMQRVWEAHGGLDRWSQHRILQFTIPGTEEGETHVTDLVSRKDRIDGPGYALGYDGKEVWLQDKGKKFEGDPAFYHNLMFYFYAMPFVLSDPGIQYHSADSLVFEDTAYPGVRISFKEGVGTSSKDEYFLYYEPETFKMAWLGYTVTYFDSSGPKDIHWIRYSAWQQAGGLLLPESITWYSTENQKPVSPENTVAFKNVALSPEPLPETFFGRPAEAQTP